MTFDRPPRSAFAHSLPGQPTTTWEPLELHLSAVGVGAARRAAAFSWGPVGEAAGILHDIGKVSDDFQAYIGAAREAASAGRVDHSTAGAHEAAKLYPGPMGRLLAFAIAGHHAGLADGDRLAERLGAAPASIPDYTGWEAYAEPPTHEVVKATSLPASSDRKGFSVAFRTRMLFSCLVDADFIETERFYTGHESRRVEREDFSSIDTLSERLRAHTSAAHHDDTPVNRLRSHVLDHALLKASLPPGLFTLTVPTGGGKTLTSMAFALEHARLHGLRRVIYVIPFTSIIEQTAGVFRKALGDADVLEHHASFDWEAELPRNARPADADGGEGRDGLAKLRRAAENWQAPIVVTTAVQFFESLFANRTSRCRKLHNLARSVIVLDEAQTLPLTLLRPCLAAIDELARNHGATVILCTATQPAVLKRDGFSDGLDIAPERELAPKPSLLFDELRRVTVERLAGPTDDAQIVERFAETPQMLCIVNSRAHAQDLFGELRRRSIPGAVHLTTLMCPRHRREVLANVRVRLAAGEPVRLVATSLIEAGVDISFPEVWRASTGLDAIAQAAGRCNRNDELAQTGRKGRVVVFEPSDSHKPPHALRALQQAAAGVLRRHVDPLSLDAVRDYFSQLYWSKRDAGHDAFDCAKLDGDVFPIMGKIADKAHNFLFPFESVARAFRMIDETMTSIIIPWDDEARQTLERVAGMDRPLANDLRRLQQYVVPIPAKARQDWMVRGTLVPVNAKFGDALLMLPDLSLYDREAGVRLSEPTYRSAECNLIA